MSRHRAVRNMRQDDYEDSYDYDDYSEEELDDDSAQYLWRGSSAAAPPPPPAVVEETQMNALVESFRAVLGVPVDRGSVQAALVASGNNPDAALTALQNQFARANLNGTSVNATAPVLPEKSLSPIGRSVLDASDTQKCVAAPPSAEPSAVSGEAFVSQGKAVIVQDLASPVQAFDFNDPSPDDIILTKRGRGDERVKNARKVKLALPKPSSRTKRSGASMSAKPSEPDESVTERDVMKTETAVAPMVPKREPKPVPKKNKLKLRVPKRAPARVHQNQKNETPEERVTKKAHVQRAKKLDLRSAATTKADNETSISIVVAGHVDAGKSTLLGHLLKLTSGETMTSNAKSGKSRGRKGQTRNKTRDLAWTTDEDPVERERGVTIDICTRVFNTERDGKRRCFAMVDAPGHRDFVPAMILGTMQASAAVLVVDASTGDFEAGVSEEGQTREHAVLLRAMGVSRLVVAINKLDNVDYSKERYDDIIKQMRLFLSMAGWRLRDVVFVPVAGRVGTNLVECAPRACVMTKWYSGNTFLSALEELADAAAKDTAASLAALRTQPTRLVVSDAFRSTSLGGVMAVSGRLLAGSVAARDQLLLSSSGELATVKNVELVGARVPVAIAGVNNTPVSLGLVDIVDTLLISPGDVLSDPAAPAPVVTRFRAQIVTIASPIPLHQGSAVEVHIGGGSEAGSLYRLVELRSSASQGPSASKKRPRRLVKGDNAVVDIKVERAVCLERAADVKAMGRFSLRAGGRIVAAGIVLEILKYKNQEKGDEAEGRENLI